MKLTPQSFLLAAAILCFVIALGDAASWWNANYSAWIAGGLIGFAASHLPFEARHG